MRRMLANENNCDTKQKKKKKKKKTKGPRGLDGLLGHLLEKEYG